MFFHVCLKSLPERRDVVPPQGEAGCVGVSPEVHQEVATVLDGCVNVKAGDASGGACGQLAVLCQDDCRPEIDFRQS